MKAITVAAAVAAIFVISARGQSFINLDFESAYNLPANPPEPDGASVPVANALPGWTAYGGSELTDVYYVSNYFYGVNTLVELEGGTVALSGNFSVGLFPGGAISQTGLVPNDAESLQFEASSALNLEVMLGGQNLSYSALSEGPNYTVYGANIPSGLDGQIETLTFIGGPDNVLDNIEFLPTSVPEPAEWALIGLGAVLFGVCWRSLTVKNRLHQGCAGAGK